MDIAVVVNLRARRGSPAVAQRCRAELPQARIFSSRSLDETRGFAETLAGAPPGLLLSAGGDGTAIGLINTLRDVDPAALRDGARDLVLGVLPLGTGNAWARATGAKSWKDALARLGEVQGRTTALPRQSFGLLDIDGHLAHFAGTGWDAEMIDDFHAQKTAPGILPKSRRDGLTGYLNGMFTRTVPRHMFGTGVEVELVNTGSDALAVDANGRAFPLPGGEHGKVLYRGPTSVCAAGTTEEWGFDFRAFPFARLVPGRFCMRIYSGSSVSATMRMGKLWRGEHPCPGMSTWLVDKCRATFSREVPFQIGGDRQGHRDVIDFAIAKEQVDLLDWRALS